MFTACSILAQATTHKVSPTAYIGEISLTVYRTMILAKVERHPLSFVDNAVQTGSARCMKLTQKMLRRYDTALLVTIIPLFGNANNVSGSKREKIRTLTFGLIEQPRPQNEQNG